MYKNILFWHSCEMTPQMLYILIKPYYPVPNLIFATTANSNYYFQLEWFLSLQIQKVVTSDWQFFVVFILNNIPWSWFYTQIHCPQQCYMTMVLIKVFVTSMPAFKVLSDSCKETIREVILRTTSWLQIKPSTIVKGINLYDRLRCNRDIKIQYKLET